MYLYSLENSTTRLPVLVKEKFISGRNTIFETPAAIVDMLNANFNLKSKAEEYVYLICADTKLHITGVFEVSHGVANSSFANPREIFIRSLLCGASNIILVHNHPSGDCTPSSSDLYNYNAIKKAGGIVGISLVDSIIVGDDTFYSFNENERKGD